MFLLVTAVVHCLLALAVFVDARRRGRSAGRWAALTLVFGIGGAAGYLIVRR